MRDMRPLFTVSPVQAGRNKFLVEGEFYSFRTGKREPFGTLHTGRDAAELAASKLTAAIIEQADDDNARVDLARHYIAARKARPGSPQLSLGF